MTTAAGWYDDPEHPGVPRWYDGTDWAPSQIAAAPVAPIAPDPAPAASPYVHLRPSYGSDAVTAASGIEGAAPHGSVSDAQHEYDNSPELQEMLARAAASPHSITRRSRVEVEPSYSAVAAAAAAVYYDDPMPPVPASDAYGSAASLLTTDEYPTYDFGNGVRSRREPIVAKGDEVLHVATWGFRFAGYLVSSVVFAVGLYATLFVVLLNASSWTSTASGPAGSPGVPWGAVILLALPQVLWAAYYVWRTGGPAGATIGMRTVRARVVRARTLQPLGYGLAFARGAVLVLITGVPAMIGWLIAVALVPSVGIDARLLVPLGYLPGLANALRPLWNAGHQCYHDTWLGTVVVELPRR